MKTEIDLIQQLKGRAKFCRDRGEVKTPELLERAVKALEQREGYKLVPIDSNEGELKRICDVLGDATVEYKATLVVKNT